MNLKNLDNIKVDEDRLENMKKDIYKKEKRSFRPAYIAAVFALIFSLGFAFPTYTKDLPIYSNIFNFFGMKNYQEAGELVNATATSNGIKITVVDAIYSNDSLAFSYLIESDEDLGEDINLESDMSFKNNKAFGASGSSYFEKKSDGVYLGYEDFDMDFKNKNVSPLKVNLKIREIQSFSNDYTSTEKYPGNWKFDLSLDQIKADIYKFDQVVEKDGYVGILDTVSIDKSGTEIKVNFMNKMGFDVLAYNQKGARFVDEDGKEYKLDLRGGTGYDGIYSTKYRLDQKLEKNKKYKLIIDLEKDDGKYFEAPADGSEPAKEVTADYVGTEAYKNAPQEIEIEIPVRIN